MSRTTFSGPVKSNNGFEGNVTGNLIGSVVGFKLQVSTAAALADASNVVNTKDKYAGKMVVDSGIIYTADGGSAGDDWYPSDGGNVISPS